MKKTVVLCILDGWGEGPAGNDNAISLAHTPHWDALKQDCPMALLSASEEAVGLPRGQMGNSEVGHMTMGAGRTVLQDLSRLTHDLSPEVFSHNKTFRTFVDGMHQAGGVCHVVGLLSDGGVHSHSDHLIQLIQHLTNESLSVCIHGLLDGRDTAPQDARDQVQAFLKAIHPYDAHLVSLGGRYFGMDRDQRWDRIERAQEAIEHGQGLSFTDPLSYIEMAYDRGESDEFMQPASLRGYEGFQRGDGLIAFNFRADRMRQLLSRLASNTALTHRLGFVSYHADLDALYPILFPKQKIKQTLGEIVAQAGLTQLRVAETEKYAHVTYFFNGGREEPFEKEDRLLIPSPTVATYDLQPEMSADHVTTAVTEALRRQQYDLIIVNYANPDMVGHSGNLAATIKAVEAVDGCLGEIRTHVQAIGGTLIVTADHGNADQMIDLKTNQIITAHSLNPVPFVMASPSRQTKITRGELKDIAPTILDLLGLEPPEDMTGESLVK